MKVFTCTVCIIFQVISQCQYKQLFLYNYLPKLLIPGLKHWFPVETRASWEYDLHCLFWVDSFIAGDTEIGVSVSASRLLSMPCSSRLFFCCQWFFSALSDLKCIRDSFVFSLRLIKYFREEHIVVLVTDYACSNLASYISEENSVSSWFC